MFIIILFSEKSKFFLLQAIPHRKIPRSIKKPDIYFKVSFKVYDIEFFTENVNSTEGFLDAEDLKK